MPALWRCSNSWAQAPPGPWLAWYSLTQVFSGPAYKATEASVRPDPSAVNAWAHAGCISMLSQTVGVVQMP